MNAQPRHVLHVVDTTTGDMTAVDRCPECAALQDQLDGAHKEIKAWRSRYAKLARDKAAEAKRSPHWPNAVRLFHLWRRLCRHPKSSWNADRFFLVEPFLAKHGVAMCERAIAGAAFDCFTKQRKNGTVERFDGWELIHRDVGKWEAFVNKAPVPFVSELEAEDELRAVKAAGE